MDQALKFEQVVIPSKFTLFFDCPESVMEQRLLDRGKTSGRADDNIDSIKKRFKTFLEQSMPVVEYFSGQGKVVKISSVPPPEEVHATVRSAFLKRGFVLKDETKEETA
jgi:UMP-CMP kinase